MLTYERRKKQIIQTDYQQEWKRAKAPDFYGDRLKELQIKSFFFIEIVANTVGVLISTPSKSKID